MRTLLSVLVMIIPVAAMAAATEVYKWEDANGIVRYSDRAPPPGAKNVQKYRSTGAGLVLEKPAPPPEAPKPAEPEAKPQEEVAQEPAAAPDSAGRLPVVVYSFDECGAVCKQAEALLDKRGVPYTRKGDDNAKAELQKLTGKLDVPVLVIGNTTPVQGFQEERWHKELDLAGYPQAAAGAKAPTTATPVK